MEQDEDEAAFLTAFGPTQIAHAVDERAFLVQYLKIGELSWRVLYNAWDMFRDAAWGMDIRWHAEFQFKQLVIDISPLYLYWKVLPLLQQQLNEKDVNENFLLLNRFYHQPENIEDREVFEPIIWFRLSYIYFRRCLILLCRKIEKIGGEVIFRDPPSPYGRPTFLEENDAQGERFKQKLGYFKYKIASQMTSRHGMDIPIWEMHLWTWKALSNFVPETWEIDFEYQHRHFETIKLTRTSIIYTPATKATGKLIRRMLGYCINLNVFILRNQARDDIILFREPLSVDAFRLCVYEFFLQKPTAHKMPPFEGGSGELKEISLRGNMKDLSMELVQKIAAQNPKTLLDISQTNTFFAELDSNPATWRYMLERDYPSAYIYFDRKVPALFECRRYLRTRGNIDYVIDATNDSIVDNSWKRWYLWLRQFYKRTGLFNESELDSPRVLMKKRCDSMRFTDPCVARFSRYLIEEIVDGFLQLEVADDEQDDRSDALAIYMMGGDQDIVTERRRMVMDVNEERHSQIIRIRKKPLNHFLDNPELYENNRYYNRFFHHLLLAIYRGDKIKKFRFCEYENDWPFPERREFFKCVADIFDGRLPPLLSTGLNLSVGLILFCNQDAVRETLDRLVADVFSDTDNDDFTWMECILSIMPSTESIRQNSLYYTIFKEEFLIEDGGSLLTRDRLAAIWEQILLGMAKLPRIMHEGHPDEGMLLLNKI